MTVARVPEMITAVAATEIGTAVPFAMRLLDLNPILRHFHRGNRLGRSYAAHWRKRNQDVHKWPTLVYAPRTGCKGKGKWKGSPGEEVY